MENKLYGYYVSYVYKVKGFSLANIFGSDTEYNFGNAVLNGIKRIEDFTIEDFEKIQDGIAENLTEELNEKHRKAYSSINKEYEYKKDLVTRDNVTIISIAPKKYEEVNRNEK